MKVMRNRLGLAVLVLFAMVVLWAAVGFAWN